MQNICYKVKRKKMNDNADIIYREITCVSGPVVVQYCLTELW